MYSSCCSLFSELQHVSIGLPKSLMIYCFRADQDALENEHV